jgi:hypothetical protein
MNGIHEVTGSIPVWSTILRSPAFAERASARQAMRRMPRHSGEAANAGKTCDLRSPRDFRTCRIATFSGVLRPAEYLTF